MVSGFTAIRVRRISHGGIDATAAATAAATASTGRTIIVVLFRMGFRLLRIVCCVAIVLLLFTIVAVTRLI